MFYDFAIVIPAGTTKANPVKQELKLCYGILRRVEVEFPAGCRGYVSLIINWREHQLYPTNPDEQFNTEDYIVPIDDYFPITVPPFSLFAVGWAPDTNYDHTITVRIGIVPVDIASPLMDLSTLFKNFLYLIGGVTITPPATPEEEIPVPPPPGEEIPPLPPEEEVPPPPPVPPAPPVPPPPIPPVPPTPPAPPEVKTGMITLYVTGLNPYSETVWPTEWTVRWYYAAQNRWLAKYADYRGVTNTPWRAVTDPITPPEPIDLNQLRFKLETFSNYDKCPMTGIKGYCNWKEFGPFVVKDGKEYEVNLPTKEFYER